MKTRPQGEIAVDGWQFNYTKRGGMYTLYLYRSWRVFETFRKMKRWLEIQYQEEIKK